MFPVRYNDIYPQQVLAYSEGLHGKWMFSEIRAVFSRRFLLQNTGLEVFMANRSEFAMILPQSKLIFNTLFMKSLIVLVHHINHICF